MRRAAALVALCLLLPACGRLGAETPEPTGGSYVFTPGPDAFPEETTASPAAAPSLPAADAPAPQAPAAPSTPAPPPVATPTTPAAPTPATPSPAAPAAAAPLACAKPAGLPTGLDPELLRRWRLAQAGAKKAGYTLTMTSGWRSWESQQLIWNQKVKALGAKEARKWALPPQDSTHVQGLAIDAGNELAARWLSRNGWRYGLCMAYANEWWHYEKGTIGAACGPLLPSAAAVPPNPCP